MADRERGVLAEHAVVIGGSTTGLLAARALSERFERVTLLEKDRFPAGPDTRKGVPQMRHVHVLLKRGESIFERFLPGLMAELCRDGAHRIDMAADTRWFHFGGWRRRFTSNMDFYCQSRPFLEWKIRSLVGRHPAVRLEDDVEVKGLCTRGGAISGVRVGSAKTPGERELAADLVVDAGGRGSRMPQWLSALGYSKPEEAKVIAEVGYASCYFDVPSGGDRDWKALFVYPRPPQKRLSVIVPIERTRWMVTHVGWFGDYPPADLAGFLEFARELPAPDVYRALRDARPCSTIATHRFPGNLWRRYDRMARFPDGLAVIGDALCSFNPIYGQGMTLGALAVETLDRCLADASTTGAPVTMASRQFRQQIARVISRVWLQTTSADLRYPQTRGRRPWWVRPLNWYGARVYELGWHHEAAARAFLEVMHMVSGPSAMLRPELMLRVVASLLRRPRPATDDGALGEEARAY